MLFPLFVETARALPGKEVETVYFSGPDFLEEVGGTSLSCGGKITRWGKTTKWFQRSETACESGSSISGCYATTLDGVTVPVACPSL